MKLWFLGGCGEVGSLSMVMQTTQDKYLFDYGYTPSKPPSFPVEAPAVSKLFLSHAHIDHSGMVPQVCSTYDANLVCSEATLPLAQMLLMDSLKVSKHEDFILPYDKKDVKHTIEEAQPMGYEDIKRFPGFEVNIHSAGHIPGSAMFEVEQDTGEKLVFTGDMNTNDTRLLYGCGSVKCDTLVLESTYAGEDHTHRAKEEFMFLDKIDEVVDRGGLAIVPSFAMGRTQEVLLMLEGRGYDVALDGMGIAITKILLDNPEYVRDAKKLKRALRQVEPVKNPTARDRAFRGEVVVTTSGMLDGGPVHQYLKRAKDNPRSAILLTGYQVEGTNGRQLVETGSMEIEGRVENVKCEVMQFDFSAHAGHKDLVKFVKACDPEKVVLVHGERREDLAADLDREVLLPEVGQVYEV